MIYGGCLHGSSFLPFSIGINSIILIILPVVYVVFLFNQWYVSSELGNLSFLQNVKLFLVSMLFFLIGNYLFLLFGWEVIGIMSFLLISWWWRFDALAGSFAAVLYNRWGDLALMLWMVYVTVSWLFVLIVLMAVLSNSSQSLQSFWLPIAMESPTPVSSLLHSSTIVVAGVLFSLILGWVWLFGLIGFLSILFISLLSLSFYDIKNIVAFSTSCHLSLMLSYVIVAPSLLVLHIITHGSVNGPVFIMSGVWIHFVGVQDLRLFSVILGYHTNMFMLMGFGVGFVLNSNEFLLFGGDLFLLILVLYVVISLRYSSTSTKQGMYLLLGTYGLLVVVFLILFLALTGLMSVTLMDIGVNWLLLCFLLSLLPPVGDINGARVVHNY